VRHPRLAALLPRRLLTLRLQTLRLQTPRLQTRRLQNAATRANAATALGVAAVLVLTGASAAAAFGGGSGKTHVTIEFPRTVGLYAGSSVRMLGVSVGSIDSITPAGTLVKVKATIKSGVKVPDDATATIVPPSLVADRYVQVSVYRSGPTLADDATIAVDHTQVPVEKDELIASLDKLDTSLGPDGANSGGALSRLVTTGARNLKGEGTQINQTLKDVSNLVAALDDNGAGITGTVDQLNTFTGILLKNDGNIKRLYTSLSAVSAQLQDDRSALAQAFATLAVATQELGDLAKGARSNIKIGVDRLADITNILVQEKASLVELIDTAPQGLTNLSGAYSPVTQTLDTRNNTPMSDSSGLGLLICTALSTTGLPGAVTDPLCTAAKGLPSPPSGGAPAPPTVPTALPTVVPTCVPTGLPVPLPAGTPSCLPGAAALSRPGPGAQAAGAAPAAPAAPTTGPTP